MKNSNIGSAITYKQYKFLDIFLFTVIMCVFEAINVFAIEKWFPDMLFSVSLMFTVSLIVLVRWNLLASFFPVLHGILYSALLGAGLETYVIYAVGNSFIILSWFLFKFIPKEKLFSKWYLTLIYPAAAFVLVVLGRCVTALCFGKDFFEILKAQVLSECINLVFAVVALLILRRIDGMLEDQKKYLFKVARERREARIQKDDVWAGYSELDEELIKSLHSEDRKQEEEGDGISMWDEYPPDSR